MTGDARPTPTPPAGPVAATGQSRGTGPTGEIGANRDTREVGAAAAAVVARLTEQGRTLAVAESLTGGLLAARVVDVPGASGVLRGGVVAYATDLKHRLLGVDADLLAARGAVDPEVAAAMAVGVRTRLGADWGLATTGVAGPDRQDGHPPGTVFVAVDGPGTAQVRRLRLAGDRAGIRAGTVLAALELLLFAIGEQST